MTQADRAKNQTILVDILAPVFKSRSAAYWLEEMDGRSVPCAPINDFAEILRDPHVKHMGLVKPLDLPNGAKTSSVAFPIVITGVDTSRMQPPPELGAHNEEVIADWLGK
jgi:crotonobetainyl-CoA:carnitine CoA-transferase CaiB-like acyl-CoA transferase